MNKEPPLSSLAVNSEPPLSSREFILGESVEGYASLWAYRGQQYIVIAPGSSALRWVCENLGQALNDGMKCSTEKFSRVHVIAYQKPFPDAGEVDGLHAYRMEFNGGSTPREKAFAQEWKEQDRVGSTITNLFHVPAKEGEDGAFRSVMDGWIKKPVGNVTRRDRVIAATLMQWLGTNVGFCFLRSALNACGFEIIEKEHKK